MSNKVDFILKTDYINNTELMKVLDYLHLPYTRQGFILLRRNPKNVLFQPDAWAFGGKFYRKDTVKKICKYVSDRKNVPVTDEDIEKAISDIVNISRGYY